MQSIAQHKTADNPLPRVIVAILAALLFLLIAPFAAVPVYLRGTSQVVGRVNGQWFCKTIRGSVHILRVPMLSIGFDVSTLEDALAAGALHVAVTDSETGKVYRQSIENVMRYGLEVRRGFGRQIALRLTAYSIDGQPPEVPPGEAPRTNQEVKDAQMSLFGGAA